MGLILDDLCVFFIFLDRMKKRKKKKQFHFVIEIPPGQHEICIIYNNMRYTAHQWAGDFFFLL